MMKQPVIIPVEPFDAKRLAREARELHDASVEWEFDWLTEDQAAALIPWLQQFGIVTP